MGNSCVGSLCSKPFFPSGTLFFASFPLFGSSQTLAVHIPWFNMVYQFISLSVNSIHEFPKTIVDNPIVRYPSSPVDHSFLMFFSAGRAPWSISDILHPPLGRWMLLWRAAWRIATGVPGHPGGWRWMMNGGFKAKWPWLFQYEVTVDHDQMMWGEGASIPNLNFSG